MFPRTSICRTALLTALLLLLGGASSAHAALGDISTLAGNGTSGSSGDGGVATAAQFRSPIGVAVMADGSVLIADTVDHRVRRVAPDGVISTFAGTGAAGFSGDGGLAITAQLNGPSGVAVAADGGVLIADRLNHAVRRVAPDGVISTVAGTGVAGFSGDGGPATAAEFRSPTGVAVAPDGSVLIADTTNRRVRRVAPDGVISTVAGTGANGSGGDGGPATAAPIAAPSGVAVAPDWSVLIADTGNNQVRRVTPDGVISTLVGDGGIGFGGDGGPATAAQLYGPYAVAVTADGNVVIADTTNHRVRRVESALLPAPVAPQLSIDLAPSVSLGPLVPTLTGTSLTTTTPVTVTSTGTHASVQILDPDTSSRKGFLVNTTTGPDGNPATYPLANALQVNGPSLTPAPLSGGPVTVFDGALTPSAPLIYSTTKQITFTQPISANEGLRSGTYGKTLTFSVSTTTP